MGIQLFPGEVDVRIVLDGKAGVFAIAKERLHGLTAGLRLRVREPKRNGDVFGIKIDRVEHGDGGRVFHATKDPPA